MALEAAVAASGSGTAALRGPGSSSCSDQERCRSASWPQNQQLQRQAAFQDRCVALEASVAASGSVARASNSARPRRGLDVNMDIYIYICIKYSFMYLVVH